MLIIGPRYGTINSSTGKSFTEQEYDYAVEKGIPVLAFLHDEPYNLPSDKRDDSNRELLEKFREKVSAERLCKMWHTSAELIASVVISLSEEVTDNPQLGWVRGDTNGSIIVNNPIKYKKKVFYAKTGNDIKSDDKKIVRSTVIEFNELFKEKIFIDLKIEGKNIVAELNCPEYINTKALLRYLVDKINVILGYNYNKIEVVNMF